MGTAAASSKDKPPAIGTTFLAGILTNSAKPPCLFTPITSNPFSNLTVGSTTTLSPSLKPVTLLPTSETTPAISIPPIFTAS